MSGCAAALACARSLGCEVASACSDAPSRAGALSGVRAEAGGGVTGGAPAPAWVRVRGVLAESDQPIAEARHAATSAAVLRPRLCGLLCNSFETTRRDIAAIVPMRVVSIGSRSRATPSRRDQRTSRQRIAVTCAVTSPLPVRAVTRSASPVHGRSGFMRHERDCPDRT
jgi:hypothetical protein